MAEEDEKKSFFDGGLLQQIGWTLLGFLVTVLTLGICYPWALTMRYAWETKHTVINGRRLVFLGSAIGLFGTWLLCILLTIITLGIYGFWVPIKIKKWKVKNTFFADEAADSILEQKKLIAEQNDKIKKQSSLFFMPKKSALILSAIGLVVCLFGIPFFTNVYSNIMMQIVFVFFLPLLIGCVGGLVPALISVCPAIFCDFLFYFGNNELFFMNIAFSILDILFICCATLLIKVFLPICKNEKIKALVPAIFLFIVSMVRGFQTVLSKGIILPYILVTLLFTAACFALCFIKYKKFQSKSENIEDVK